MEQWATAVNDSSYTFDQTLPFYKNSVKFTPPNTQIRAKNATAGYDPSAYESTGGPLKVSYANYAMPFSTWMDLGMKAIGINETQDFNLGSLMGGQYCASTIDPNGEVRSSSEESFLANKPSTLTTYANTLAKKIIFNNQKQATGVQVKGSAGNIYTIKANREVIVSAGAFQSPQLLMVSGVGPQDQLEEHGIQVVANRPGVGQNMWDHPFFAPSYRVNVQTFTAIANDFLGIVGQFINMVGFGNGPLTNPISDYLAWEKIPAALRSAFSSQTTKQLATFPSDWPEAEVCVYLVCALHTTGTLILYSTSPVPDTWATCPTCSSTSPKTATSTPLCWRCSSPRPLAATSHSVQLTPTTSPSSTPTGSPLNPTRRSPSPCLSVFARHSRARPWRQSSLAMSTTLVWRYSRTSRSSSGSRIMS